MSLPPHNFNVRHVVITDLWEIKLKVWCNGNRQIYEILISQKSVNWHNSRRERTHRQHGETRG